MGPILEVKRIPVSILPPSIQSPLSSSNYALYELISYRVNVSPVISLIVPVVDLVLDVCKSNNTRDLGGRVQVKFFKEFLEFLICGMIVIQESKDMFVESLAQKVKVKEKIRDIRFLIRRLS